MSFRSVQEDLEEFSRRVNSASMGALMRRLATLEPSSLNLDPIVSETDAFAIRLAGLVRYLHLSCSLVCPWPLLDVSVLRNVFLQQTETCSTFLKSFPQTNEVKRTKKVVGFLLDRGNKKKGVSFCSVVLWSVAACCSCFSGTIRASSGDWCSGRAEFER
jgi:hypothetical protein